MISLLVGAVMFAGAVLLQDDQYLCAACVLGGVFNLGIYLDTIINGET